MPHLKATVLLALTLGFAATTLPAAANPLVFGNKRISIITPTLLRLEYAEQGRFTDAPTMFAINRDSLMHDGYTVTRIDSTRQVEINTGKVRMVFADDNLPFGQGNTRFFFTRYGKESSATGRNLHSKTRRLNLGGSVATLDAVSAEIPTDDGLLSEDGWYYLIDTGSDIIGADGWFAPRPRESVQDQYCFIYGDDFHAPFHDLGVISGKVPMTRKYMHGVWYSRWYPYDDNYINELVEGFDREGFPLDVLSMDMDWHTIADARTGIGHNNTALGWTGFTWNRSLIADPGATIGRLHADSIRVCVNEHPHDGVRPHEDCYRSFMELMGYPAATDTVLLFDAGDKKYLEAYLEATRAENRELGVDFWWLDWQQDYLYPKVRGSQMSHVKWLNRNFYEDTRRGGMRGAGYSRWGGWGDHRHPIHFSGDARSNWDVLRFEVKLSQTSGNQGGYYWAHDIGGFAGKSEPELLARWCQFGALSAALRTHAHRGPEADRRPWIWGDKATESMRASYRLRSRLMPYIYSAVRRTHESMLPLNRCMFVDYPTEAEAYNRYGQYLFGDLLLAAPITAKGEGDDFTAASEVWFPADCDWYDFFSDERHEGGTTAKVAKPLAEFPLFVRGGTLLPMQPFTRRPGSSQPEHLVLRVYPGADGCDNSFELYEDDGVSEAYTRGEYCKTALLFRRNGSEVELSVLPGKGSYEGKPESRSYTFELAGFEKVEGLRVNGRRAKVTENGGRRIVSVPEQKIDKPVIITFTI